MPKQHVSTRGQTLGFPGRGDLIHVGGEKRNEATSQVGLGIDLPDRAELEMNRERRSFRHCGGIAPRHRGLKLRPPLSEGLFLQVGPET
jgi:hypothetical protein